MESASPPFKILLVEDDVILLNRLHRIIDNHPMLQVMAAFETVSETINWLHNNRPDVVLVDLQLPDGHGTQIIRLLKQKNLQSMVLTVFSDERNVTLAIKAGATGYLLKDSDNDRIVESILQLIDGQSPISAGIARHILKYFSCPELVEENIPPETILTVKQVEVLELISRGFSYKEVARQLDMSINTVRTHIRHIYNKLEVSSGSEAVFEASHRGLLPH